ncbi:MAG: ABC transporter permease [Brevinema sp.]
MFGSQLGSIITRLRKNKLAIAGFFILMLFVILAVFADYIADYEQVVIKQNLSNTFAKPGTSALLGTDDLGRDIFARIVHGTRISLTIGFISVTLSVIIGGLLGALAGYWGGRLDNIVMRIMDIFLAIPSILLSIAIVSALGPSFFNLVLALSVSTVPVYARIVRASVLSIRGQEFIEAAHAIGSKDFYIIIKHIIPNVFSPIIVQATLGVASAILSIAGLSFIGLGVEPPTPEWGSMLAGGRTLIRRAPWITTYPGIAIMLSILSLNLLGDGLRDALDPRLK